MLDTQIKRRLINQDDSLVPLINIVFLMLIFFMVAGQITTSDLVKVDPLLSQSDKRIAGESLKVVINQQGLVFIKGKLIKKNQLTEYVSSYVVSQGADKHLQDKHLQVLVKADGNLSIEVLRPILRQIKAAGISHLSLMTIQMEE
ncbi:MAG: biopolymer transporter ExbD [Gammaproteobacteria bacterium]|nr:biopolymer transporter ExbD [Gammaproteobacteria bacterium]